MQSLTNKLSQHILAKTRFLRQLQKLVTSCLPLDCHEHIQVTGIRENQLIILTDSPVWQTRLRLYSPTMIDAINQQDSLPMVNRVKIRLSPLQREIEKPAPEPRNLSDNSARIIAQTASAIDDTGLQAALYKLSQRSEQKKKKP